MRSHEMRSYLVMKWRVATRFLNRKTDISQKMLKIACCLRDNEQFLTHIRF